MASKRAAKKSGAKAKAADGAAPARRALLYKVVELSSVDEHGLERAINQWVAEGWAFDGVQFAMRESSKRPAMAFVFFTKEGEAVVEQPSVVVAAAVAVHDFRPVDDAEAHLKRLAADAEAEGSPMNDAWERLAALAKDEANDP